MEQNEGESSPKVAADPAAEAQLDLDHHAHAYLLQEAAVLGERVNWYLESLEKLEGFAMVASSAIWAFIFTQPYTPFIDVMKWVPALLCLVFFYKSRLFLDTIKQAFGYIRKVEKACCLPQGLGWIQHFNMQSSNAKRRWRLFFWTVITFSNILAAALTPFPLILNS